MRGIEALSAMFLLAIILISGCTTTQQTTTSTVTTTVTSITEFTTTTTVPTTTSTTTTVPTTTVPTTTATTSTQPVQPCSRATIDGPALISHLPGAQPGWDAEDPDWVSEETDEGCENTRAWIVFTQGELEVNIHIYDSNHISAFPPEEMGYGTVYQDSDGYGKVLSVNGFDAWETAMYDEGLMVWVEIGNGIWVIVQLSESTDTSLLYPYLYSVDYDDLAALA